VTPLGDGRYLVDDGMRRRVAYAVRGRDTWVFLDGRVYTLGPVDRSSRARRSRDEAGALDAPMPATVLAVHVTPGQQVRRDDTLVLLEAMKMELPIRAPRDGVITAVSCQVGQLVAPGTRLVEME
jgi:biotin carboxyl carrier protein